MHSITRSTLLRLSGICALIGVSATSEANLLVDAGFEAPPLGQVPLIGSNIRPFTPDIWVAENASKVIGPNLGVIPYAGNQMLRMEKIGGTQTQAWQFTDVTSRSTIIDLGGETATLSAWFNAPGDSSARGGLGLWFFGPGEWDDLIIAPVTVAFNLDGDREVWEYFTLEHAIPVGTRWIGSSPWFENARLGNSEAGFVDNPNLTIPTPAPILLLAPLTLLMLRRARRAV